MTGFQGRQRQRDEEETEGVWGVGGYTQTLSKNSYVPISLQISLARFSCLSCTMKIANNNKEQRREARAEGGDSSGVVLDLCMYILATSHVPEQQAVGSFRLVLVSILVDSSSRVFPAVLLGFHISFWERGRCGNVLAVTSPHPLWPYLLLPPWS